jgi:hypothetical protein
MKKRLLKIALEEVERFRERGLHALHNVALLDNNTDTFEYPSAAIAAVRRASMDLSKSLSALRRIR